MVHSHMHADHIAAVNSLLKKGTPIIAQRMKRLLQRANDPSRLANRYI